MKIPSTLLARVTESVRAFVLSSLPYDHADSAVFAHLNGMDATGLLITWFNWSWRMITPHPRVVHLSREIVANPLEKRYRPELSQLLSDIEAGVDLRKYLSRKVVHVTTPPRNVDLPKKRKRRLHIDEMLNAWGIHHLHIGKELEPDGFVKRSDHLLFCAFKRGHAYVLDIMPHKGAWGQESIIRIIIENWPSAKIVHRMEGVVGLSRKIDDAERNTMMRKHINSLIEIDGAVYMPDGGLMGSGDSIYAVRNADLIMIHIKEFVQNIIANPIHLFELMDTQKIPVPAELSLNFFMDENVFGLIEPESKTLFKL